jgi:hypothetical protein
MKTIDLIEVSEKQRRKKKERSTGTAFVGKDILELISVSMYTEPLTLYREYIQNATDSIDGAVVSGILTDVGQGTVSVSISQSTRTITIRDNGEGVSNRKFQKLMLSFGASEKRGTEARGFRGVGRFAGLGYCQELIFRTKCADDPMVSEVIWDGHTLKRLLADNTETLSITQLVQKVATFSEYKSDLPAEHFFEVELRAVVRAGQDTLLNEETVSRYLTQICPVPYSPNFSAGEKLNGLLRSHGVEAGYDITLMSEFFPKEKIYRPYRDKFQMSEHESDLIVDVDVFELTGVHGDLAAFGWIFTHSYKGIIPVEGNIRGIRVRVGNTQIGEEALMTSAFPEPRFNSWSMGEIHVVERKLSPNGRRDNFDNNVHWFELQNQFAQHAKEIARICRRNSSQRNAIKQFNSEIQKMMEFEGLLTSGVLSKPKVKELDKKLSESLMKAETLCNASQISDAERVPLLAILNKQAKLPKASSSNEVFELIPRGKHGAVREIFDFIYECSANKVVAKSLIDKIVDQYRSKYG